MKDKLKSFKEKVGKIQSLIEDISVEMEDAMEEEVDSNVKEDMCEAYDSINYCATEIEEAIGYLDEAIRKA